jgi:hypothetical protein
MVQLGDRLNKKLVSICLESAILDARSVHGLRRTFHRLKNLFLTHLVELLGDVGHLESRFGLFGDSVSVHAR